MSALHDGAVVFDAGTATLGRSLLKDEFLRINDAKDDHALASGIQVFISDTGFDRYSVSVIRDDFLSRNSCNLVGELHNAPAEYLEAYDDRETCKVDPVMQLCKRSSAPVIYGRDTYVALGAGETWEHQSQFGFAYGIVSAFHLPLNQHVIFGVDRHGPLPTHPAELTELVARVHLFGTFVQCAALNLLTSRPESDLVLASSNASSGRPKERPPGRPACSCRLPKRPSPKCWPMRSGSWAASTSHRPS